MKEQIKHIVENYKGVKVGHLFISDKGDYVGILSNAPKQRTMELASVKIFKKFPFVEFINWQGAWLNYVYTRRTLSYLGYKF